MGRAGRPGSLARAVLGWVLLAGLTSAAAVGTHAPLRSELYPEDWQPGVPDDAGRLLPDVSYAGYRYGQEPPANVPGPVVDVTDPPYGADPSGEEDATAAIQRALDDVGAAGGGTVHLPAGTYRVEPPDDSRAVLHIGYDGVLLRGAGAAATRLYNATARDIRERAVVLLAPDRRDRVSWHEEHTAAAGLRLTRDVRTPTRTLHVADAESLAVGDWVVVRAETTAQWLAEHPVAEDQRWDEDTLDALVLHRRVTAVDTAADTVEIDIPTRLPLLRRDEARLVAVLEPLVGSGVADLAIGMRQSERGERDPEEDHERRGTAGHEAHQATAVTFNGVVDGWVQGVRSYRPPENEDDVHLLSVGIYVRDARNITVRDVDLRRPQYRGAGGNGYLVHLMGSDTLVRDAVAVGGRHNYLVQGVQATGNVVLESRAVDGERAIELHRHLSAANLFDNLSVERDTLEMTYRRASNHAHSATESVMWNVSGEDCTRGRLAVSRQYGWGYVIGTSGTGDCARVENPGGAGTEPRDWVEHVGDGDRLEPRSLYLDQLARRTGADATSAPPAPSPEPTGDDGAPVGLLVGGGVLLLAAVAAGALALARRRRVDST